jgi:ribosomal protein S18 acetylase RimI-like enzyme
MKHILDNPVWEALTTGNLKLSEGNEVAKYFPSDISPFAGVKELTTDNFQTLYDIIPFDSPVAIFTNEKTLVPAPWHIINRIDGYQLLFTKTLLPETSAIAITKLDERHIPEMLTLTKLTNPGPFLSNTIAFGNYEGILANGKLVAMAGQRLHSGNFVEISAVCTHPSHLGKGYARHLIQSQIRQIQANSEVPYLHVRADNERAIKIYQSMGFEIRNELIIYVIRKLKAENLL